MPKVFISHSSGDVNFVTNELIGLCLALGLTPWLSEDHIETSADWERSIRAALETSDWFLLIMSPRSVGSKWVRNELHWALENLPETIIPILVEPCKTIDFHLSIPQLQLLDFHADPKRAREKLIATFVQSFYQPIRDYEPRLKAALVGSWDSYWESKLSQDPPWVNERLQINTRGGLHTIQAVDNSAGYDWSATGRFQTGTVFAFHWRVNKAGAESSGVATLYRNTEGHYLVGHWYGPNGRGSPSIGRWIVVKPGVDAVMVAKEWFGSSVAESLRRCIRNLISKPRS